MKKKPTENRRSKPGQKKKLPSKPKPRKRTKHKQPYRRTGYRLTLKQEGFCHTYMETGNMSEAYRKNYNCSRMKPETVNRKAKELMDSGKISARIRKLQDELKHVSNIEKERLLYELEAILQSKITDYVEIKDGKLQFKDFDKLTEQQVRAIESVKDTKYGIELRLHGKSWTLDRICKMLGYEAPKKIDHTTKGEKIQQENKIIILPSNERDNANLEKNGD